MEEIILTRNSSLLII